MQMYQGTEYYQVYVCIFFKNISNSFISSYFKMNPSATQREFISFAKLTT
jgi:hypothetical protein